MQRKFLSSVIRPVVNRNAAGAWWRMIESARTGRRRSSSIILANKQFSVHGPLPVVIRRTDIAVVAARRRRASAAGARVHRAFWCLTWT
jgi:hypothetical protein